MSNLKYMEDYHTDFDPVAFVNKPRERHHLFVLEAYHKFWLEFGNHGSSKNPSEIRYLEYGGGPSITSLVSAAPKVDRIVFAEYTEANRNYLKSWIDGRPEAFDWSPAVEYVVRDLEENSIPGAVSDRELEIKRKIKSVVPCDVTAAPIVDLEPEDVGKPFDVVSTTLCLETCSASESQYKNNVVKLAKFVRPHGYLCMYGAFGASFYCFGETKFYCFPLNKTMVEEAMKEAEFEDIMIDEIAVKPGRKRSNTSAMFAAFGRKVRQSERTIDM